MEIVGLSEEKVKKISKIKHENDWVLDYRLKGYKSFVEQKMPLFGPEINLNFDDVIYYKNNEADKKLENNWNNILKPVVDELDSVGVLESEKHFGGMGVQYESEVIYHNMIEELEKKNVIFTSIEDAIKKQVDSKKNVSEFVDKFLEEIIVYKGDNDRHKLMLKIYLNLLKKPIPTGKGARHIDDDKYSPIFTKEVETLDLGRADFQRNNFRINVYLSYDID